MSNKKRSTKRQVRVPVKFNNHVVGNLSQKRNDNCAEELNEQIWVLDEDPNVKGGNDKNDLTNVIDEYLMEYKGKTRVRTMPMLLRDELIDNKLNFVPTGLNELGNEVVVFDEELVEIGSEK
ncbi:hypothetical protein Tco_1239815 [Tanacetum coccineum]